ncbi:CPBP family intramembrane glutamic endopeptidase [Metabacillus mangrovi]|nr:CPBP family intramembrane glutamic endopeptidase [Metabacillus mangrovi]
MSSYLDSFSGRNSWKRYLSSLAVVLGFLLIGGIAYGLSLIMAIQLDGDSYFDIELGRSIGLSPYIEFMLLNSVYLFWLLGLFISVRFIHKRPLRSLVTHRDHVQWGRVFWGFGVFLGIYLLLNVADLLIFQEGFKVNPGTSPSQFLLLFGLVLIFTPIQTTVEELFFRGFLAQWIGKGVRNPLLLSLIIALIFGSLHFANPEMSRSALFVGLEYLFAGFMLTYVAVKTGTAELSIGAHAANNIFLFLFFSDKQSVGGELPALFEAGEVNAGISLLWSVVLFGVFYWMSMRKYGGQE